MPVFFSPHAVAQRILKTKNHVLAIGGKKYPLEVTAHVVELSPDEVARGRELLPAGAPRVAATAPAGSQTGFCAWKGELAPSFNLNWISCLFIFK